MPIGLEPERASRHFHHKRWARRAICTPSIPSSVTIMRSRVQAASTASNFSDLVWMSRDTTSKRQRKGEENVCGKPFRDALARSWGSAQASARRLPTGSPPKPNARGRSAGPQVPSRPFMGMYRLTSAMASDCFIVFTCFRWCLIAFSPVRSPFVLGLPYVCPLLRPCAGVAFVILACLLL